MAIAETENENPWLSFDELLIQADMENQRPTALKACSRCISNIENDQLPQPIQKTKGYLEEFLLVELGEKNADGSGPSPLACRYQKKQMVC